MGSSQVGITGSFNRLPHSDRNNFLQIRRKFNDIYIKSQDDENLKEIFLKHAKKYSQFKPSTGERSVMSYRERTKIDKIDANFSTKNPM